VSSLCLRPHFGHCLGALRIHPQGHVIHSPMCRGVSFGACFSALMVDLPGSWGREGAGYFGNPMLARIINIVNGLRNKKRREEMYRNFILRRRGAIWSCMCTRPGLEVSGLGTHDTAGRAAGQKRTERSDIPDRSAFLPVPDAYTPDSGRPCRVVCVALLTPPFKDAACSRPKPCFGIGTVEISPICNICQSSHYIL